MSEFGDTIPYTVGNNTIDLSAQLEQQLDSQLSDDPLDTQEEEKKSEKTEKPELHTVEMKTVDLKRETKAQEKPAEEVKEETSGKDPSKDKTISLINESKYLRYISELRKADSELALAKAESAELVRQMDNYRGHYTEYEEIIQKLKANDIVDIGILPLSKLGLMKWTKTRRLLSSFLEDCRFSDLKIPFCCVAVDIRSGTLQVFSEGSVTDAILASSSMPTVFRPVEKDGMLLVDGGVLCRVPVRQVKKMGADVVVAVDVLGPCLPSDKPSNMISLITRVYDIMDSARTADERRKTRRIADLWLEPDMPGVSQYTVKYHSSAYDAGYKLGRENADTIKTLLEEGA